MKRTSIVLVIFLLLFLCFPDTSYSQIVIRDTGVVVDTPTIAITTATADTTASSSSSAHSVIVQFRFGTLTGSFSGCTVQAKTSIDGGATYLTLSSAASITVTSGAVNTWMVTDKGPASGNTSTPSSTASIGFGQLTKFTFACSSYGTLAPATVTAIYGNSPIGGASGGGGGGGAVTAGNGDIEPLGSTTDTRCTATDTTSEGMICLLKQVVYLLGNALTVSDGSGALNVIVDSIPAITANAGTNLNTSALALEAGNLASLLTSLGATSDASVAAGATGSVEAKLRRATQGLEDLKSLIVLAAGANIIGKVGFDTSNNTVKLTDGSGNSISANTDDCDGTTLSKEIYQSVGTSEDEHAIKASPGSLCTIRASNAHASANAWIKCTNLSAASTTPGSSAIFYEIMVPFGLTITDSKIHLPFSTALTCYIVLGKTAAAVDEVAADDVHYTVTYR